MSIENCARFTLRYIKSNTLQYSRTKSDYIISIVLQYCLLYIVYSNGSQHFNVHVAPTYFENFHVSLIAAK